jgi:peptidoglycan/xylan/chitin deacetylase (PgdA/CDA1 family)
LKTTYGISLVFCALCSLAAPHSSAANIEPMARVITRWRQTSVTQKPAEQHRPKTQEPQDAASEAQLPSQERMPSLKELKQKDDEEKQQGIAFAKLQRGNTGRKEIALTFDDGPHPSFTPKLLDLLKQLNVHATFFMVGEKVDQAPYLLPRMLQEGHDIANHTYHHVNLKKIPSELVDNEIRLANDAIRRASGQEPTFFRPPGGQYNADVIDDAEKLKMITVLWTDDPGDYASPGAEVIEDRLLKHVRPGAVILLHDGMEQTYSILPDFVAKMRSEGYKFVTLTEMARHLEATHLAHRE